ncbi:MAG: DUF58 domain-containing protein [Kofleriaceae bacterium]|nr:DUF58 domain-containing protein [Kofleriaceae bacterium]
MTAALLTGDELRELAALAARVRGRAGEAAGTAATARLGRGYELHGHDPYRPGDDARAIDWRARLRTGELWVRRHRAEGDGGVRLMVDDSASMTEARRAVAARLAAALAVVAGAAALPVAIDGLAGAGRRGGADRARLDAAGAQRALARLGALGRGGTLGLGDALARACRAVRPDEQVVLLSDLADPAPPDELAAAVARLARRIACVHLVDGRDAELGGGVDELRCAETGARRRLDDAAATGFAAAIAGWRRRVVDGLRHRGVPVVVIDAASPPRLVDAAGELVALWS